MGVGYAREVCVYQERIRGFGVLVRGNGGVGGVGGLSYVLWGLWLKHHLHSPAHPDHSLLTRHSSSAVLVCSG